MTTSIELTQAQLATLQTKVDQARTDGNYSAAYQELQNIALEGYKPQMTQEMADLVALARWLDVAAHTNELKGSASH